MYYSRSLFIGRSISNAIYNENKPSCIRRTKLRKTHNAIKENSDREENEKAYFIWTHPIIPSTFVSHWNKGVVCIFGWHFDEVFQLVCKKINVITVGGGFKIFRSSLI